MLNLITKHIRFKNIFKERILFSNYNIPIIKSEVCLFLRIYIKYNINGNFIILNIHEESYDACKNIIFELPLITHIILKF